MTELREFDGGRFEMLEYWRMCAQRLLELPDHVTVHAHSSLVGM